MLGQPLAFIRIAAAAEELSAQAAEMRNLVASYQLTNAGSVLSAGMPTLAHVPAPKREPALAHVGPNGRGNGHEADASDPLSVIPFGDDDGEDMFKNF